MTHNIRNSDGDVIARFTPETDTIQVKDGPVAWQLINLANYRNREADAEPKSFTAAGTVGMGNTNT